MLRSATAVALVLALAWGVSASKPMHELEESSCWGCHRPGAWTEPMAMPDILKRATDDGVVLDVTNPWNQMVDSRIIVVDKADKPAVEQPATREATLHFMAPSTHSNAHGITHNMPAGAAAAMLGIDGPADQDLAVIIRPADGLIAAISMDGPRSLRLDAQDVAAMGSGSWHFEVIWNPDPTRPVVDGFDVRVWLQPVASPGVHIVDVPRLDVYDRATVSLPPGVSTDIATFAVAKVNYDHEGAEPDTELVRYEPTMREPPARERLETTTPGIGAAVGALALLGAVAVARRH